MEAGLGREILGDKRLAGDQRIALERIPSGRHLGQLGETALAEARAELQGRLVGEQLEEVCALRVLLGMSGILLQTRKCHSYRARRHQAPS